MILLRERNTSGCVLTSYTVCVLKEEMWNYSHNFVFDITVLLKLYEYCGMLMNL